MGNAAPKKLSSSYPDVEVYHVRNVWMHFQKAYSLGSGTFGLVFAANPKTSKISRAISEAAEAKHSSPVPLAQITLPNGVSYESSRTSAPTPIKLTRPLSSSHHQPHAYSFGGGGADHSFLSSSTLPSVDALGELQSMDSLGPASPVEEVSPQKNKTPAMMAFGKKPFVRRNWSTDNTPSEDEQPKDVPSSVPESPIFDRLPSSEASSENESDQKGPQFTNRRVRSALSPYRTTTLEQRRERAQTAIAKGEAIQMEVAVKVMAKVKDKAERKIQKSEFANEVRILKKLLTCDGVVQYQGAIVDNQHYCIVTEMCRGGELWAYMAKLPNHRCNEFEASRVIQRILQGLYFCHVRGICHLDLKPENIMLHKKDDLDSLKIVDFGCAKFTHDSNGDPVKYEEFKGSLDFAAPEVIGQYALVKGDAIKAVDMWAIGVLTFLSVTGSLPFGQGSDGQKRANIFNCHYEYPKNLTLSTACQDFIGRLLKNNSADRMTVSEALDHPWIKNAEQVASKESFDPLVLRGLQSYHKVSMFRKIIASLLVRAMTDKEKEFIKDLFNRFDADGSGYLDLSEVSQVLKQAFGLTDDEAKEEAAEVVNKFDANSDGVISWEEFAELTFQGSLVTDKSRIRQAFRLIDQNSDGVISIEELKSAFCIGTEESFVSETAFYDMIKQIDENEDGVISFDEFTRGISRENSTSITSPHRSRMHARTRSAGV
eukprot:TRINITY_DN74015_c0_g1_i1.p1 TRINITY_DN74015_c0_g1~~TRINITY_DN74015_c0_g1_i1.p1  ORF type:complete len:752 (+),score=120.28 TRINITY_DN74015_c0_g1_i1:121-2256(+)